MLKRLSVKQRSCTFLDCKQNILRLSHFIDNLNELYFKGLTLVRCAREGACVYVDHVTAIPSVPQIPTSATVARSANVMITPVITLRISFAEVLFCFLVSYIKLIRSLSTCELVSVN